MDKIETTFYNHFASLSRHEDSLSFSFSDHLAVIPTFIEKTDILNHTIMKIILKYTYLMTLLQIFIYRSNCAK